MAICKLVFIVISKQVKQIQRKYENYLIILIYISTNSLKLTDFSTFCFIKVPIYESLSKFPAFITLNIFLHSLSYPSLSASGFPVSKPEHTI